LSAPPGVLPGAAKPQQFLGMPTRFEGARRIVVKTDGKLAVVGFRAERVVETRR
jgi:hypothetical protein